jgi:enoyl-CoA hydratase/carnithine racemase
VNNAYNGALIDGVLEALEALGGHDGLRAVVLKGNGKHFQAGADLKWINSVRTASPEENLRVSRATADAVQRLNSVPVPTVALVQGGCFGGGTGIVAACDVVLAADNAMFSIAEVRWGLHASIIIPQLADAIGVRQLRRYALTGERFGAEEAAASGSRTAWLRSASSRPRARASSTTCWRTARRRSPRPRPWVLRSAWSNLASRTSAPWSRATRKNASPPRRSRGWRRSPRSVRHAGKRADSRPDCIGACPFPENRYPFFRDMR